MMSFRRSALLLSVFIAAACERGKAPPPVDTSALHAAHVADSAALASSTTKNWDAGAGPVLLVAAASPAQAIVIPPDSARAAEQLAGIPHPASVTLFGRNGSVQTAELPGVVDTAVCAVAPLNASPPPKAWSVGFIGGAVSPLALDSIESLRGDSAALAVEMTRLASALPNDPAGRFAGLPFVIRSMWRFTIPSGPQVVVATFIRQINQEATPLQERTLIVGERAPKDSTFTAGYSERSYGQEETIESRDVLAAVLIGSSRTPSLILAHDYGDATAYGLVERGDGGRWRSRWLSASRRCPASGTLDSR
jgi:hypothetical protein